MIDLQTEKVQTAHRSSIQDSCKTERCTPGPNARFDFQCFIPASCFDAPGLYLDTNAQAAVQPLGLYMFTCFAC